LRKKLEIKKKSNIKVPVLKKILKKQINKKMDPQSVYKKSENAA
jgi:hypothetical protein